MTTILGRNIQVSHADLVQHLTPTAIPGIDLSSIDRLGEYGAGAMVAVNAMVNRQAAMVAYINDFWMMAIIIALCVPLIFLAKAPPPVAGAPPPPME